VIYKFDVPPCSLKQFAADHTVEEFLAPEEQSRIESALQEAKQAAEAAKQAAIAAALQDARDVPKGAASTRFTYCQLFYVVNFAVLKKMLGKVSFHTSLVERAWVLELFLVTAFFYSICHVKAHSTIVCSCCRQVPFLLRRDAALTSSVRRLQL
jgi:hypothetical protein